MLKNFVTLFNASYLSRGLVLYQSLVDYCDDFHLYIICFDDVTLNYFKENKYKYITPISLTDFEDDELLSVKPTRSAAEYCWTCTPSTVLYCINTFHLIHCVYIDADMRFYSNPQVLFDEWGTNSIALTEHRYTTEYDQTILNGKYCVQFVGFKKDEEGLNALNYWRNACLDWCYARPENGKFGDQKYLDDWLTRFKKVHVIGHLGAGIAPWNMQQFTFSNKNHKIMGTEINTGKKFEAVFFHFHGLKFFKENIVSLTGSYYRMSKQVKSIFYFPYVSSLNKAFKLIEGQKYNINAHGINSEPTYNVLGLNTLFKYYKEGLKKTKFNVFGFNVIQNIKRHYYYNYTKF